MRIFGRYLMLKYADRGLVKNGRISKLFEHLYVTMTGSVGIWGMSMGFFAYLTGDNEEKHTLTKICQNKTDNLLTVADGLKVGWGTGFLKSLLTIILTWEVMSDPN